MEMPSYHIPALRNVLRNVRDRIFLFVRDAGTVILACSVVLWFLASHPSNPELSRAEQLRQSYAGQLGQFIEPAIEPLGFDWKIGVSLLASFAAREVFVSSMATVYNLEDADESNATLISSLHGSGYGLLTAISLMIFFAFACQCMSTLAVCKRETGGWRWPALMFIYMSVLAYLSSLLVYQVGMAWMGAK